MKARKNPHSQSEFPAGLAKPAQRALASAGYLQLKDLAKLAEADLKQLHGMGPKAIDLLRRALRKKGLAFATPKGRKL